MRFVRWVIVGSFALVGVAQAGVFEHTIGWNEVPPAAQASIERAAQGASVLKVQREFEHGRWLYEAKVRYPGQHHKTKIEVDQEGNLIHIH